MARHQHVPSPPIDRMPAVVRDAVLAAQLAKNGGPPLTVDQTMALLDLSAWDFNGVAPDHPQYEARLASWAAEIEARHQPRAA